MTTTTSISKPSTTIRRSTKQIAFDFFYANAGYSVRQSESQERGRARSARAMAEAESIASASGYTFTWDDDWSCGNHHEEYGECYANGEPTTCEMCCCIDPQGECVASVGCIDDATREYRRVIEAELAMEALG